MVNTYCALCGSNNTKNVLLLRDFELKKTIQIHINFMSCLDCNVLECLDDPFEVAMTNLDNIDYRMKVGSASWEKKHDKDTQQLSAWRRLHALLPHKDVVKLAKPTDNPEKLAALVKEIESQLKEGK